MNETTWNVVTPERRQTEIEKIIAAEAASRSDQVAKNMLYDADHMLLCMALSADKAYDYGYENPDAEIEVTRQHVREAVALALMWLERS